MNSLSSRSRITQRLPIRMGAVLLVSALLALLGAAAAVAAGALDQEPVETAGPDELLREGQRLTDDSTALLTRIAHQLTGAEINHDAIRRDCLREKFDKAKHLFARVRGGLTDLITATARHDEMARALAATSIREQHQLLVAARRSADGCVGELLLYTNEEGMTVEVEIDPSIPQPDPTVLDPLGPSSGTADPNHAAAPIDPMQFLDSARAPAASAPL